MAMRADVVVVGGGLAGLMSGIAAAREGVRVIVLTATESSLPQASGLIDVLGYPTPGPGPVADPFEAMAGLPAEHPYRLLGTEVVKAGLALFDEQAETLYNGSGTPLNALVPTAAGTVKPTARYPTSMGAGLASSNDRTLIVGFERIPDVHGPFVAQSLSRYDVPFAVRGETCRFPGDFRTDAKITRYAHALDGNESVRFEGAERAIRQALAETLADVIDDAERLGLPAILGIEHVAEVRASLSSELGIEVFELPMAPPSIPGMRLASRLKTALREAGGHFHDGAPVVDFDTEGARITAVTVDRNGAEIPYAAGQFVLATGGLVGKGIRATRDGIAEPVFGCQVTQPSDRYQWFVNDVFGDQPYPKFGVDVDENLRPLDDAGSAEFRNLRAAGSVIGGFDFPAENSGSGVSIATGARAGKAAGREA